MEKQDAQVFDKLAVKQGSLEPQDSHLNIIWEYRA